MNRNTLKYSLFFGRIFYFVISIFLYLKGFSQKEANNWYFGNGAGITFNTNPPTGLTNGQLNTYEGCATISDKNGKLLFYTDGIKVWDSTHNVTPNGSGLKGNSSSTQSAVVVPKPGNSKQYYIFTVDHVAGPDGLEYSLFDLTLNSGKGDVVSTQKNIELVDTTCEKITAVQHGNGKDFWVLTHKFNSDSIFAYLVNSSGVNHTAVISTTGLRVFGGVGSTLGYIKSSPDGTKLAYANWTFDTCGYGDFDSYTGAVSNVWTFKVDDAYGIEFSATSNYLYFAEMYKWGIYQYNAKAKTKASFLSSKITIDSINRGPIGALQLGPDKKIYICRTSKSILDVIHAPDSAGTKCRVQYNYVNLMGRTCNYGLPTFIQSYFKANFAFKGNCFGDTAWFSIADSSIVDSVYWSFDDTASKSKNSAKGFRVFHLFSDTGFYKVRSIAFKGSLRDTTYLNVDQRIYLGRFHDLEKVVYKCYDDTISIIVKHGEEKRVKWSNNSDSIFTRVRDSGYLTVKKYYGSKCYADDSIHVIYYQSNKINGPFSIGKDIMKCSYDSVKLSFYDPKSTKYEWSTGKINTPINVLKPATIWLKSYYGGSCFKSDTLKVGNFPSYKFTLGKDTFVCGKQPIMLGYFEEGFYEYLWNTNSTDPFLLTDTAGVFSLRVKDSSKCFKTDTIRVSFLKTPKVNLGKDTIICGNLPFALDAKNTSPFNKYKWGTSVTKQIDTAKKTGKFWVRVTNTCGTSIDTINLKFLKIPKASLPKDSIFCNKVNIVLDAANINNEVNYNWTNNNKTQSILVQDTGIYKIVVSNSCGKDSTSFHLSKYLTPTSPFVKDSIFCKPFVFKLKTGKPNNGETYIWNDLTYIEQLNVIDTFIRSKPGIIETISVNKCGVARDTFELKRLNPPKVKLDSLYEFCGLVNLNLSIKKLGNQEKYVWSTSQILDSINIKTAGKYWAKAMNYCGKDSVNFRIALYQKPKINLGNDTTHCGTINRILDADIKDTKANYKWFSGQTTPTLTVNSNGKFGVSVSNFCGIAIDSINFNLYKKVIPKIGPDQIFCDKMFPISRNVSITKADTAQWSTGKKDTIETFTKQGKYWIKISNPCGSNSDTVNFKLSVSPQVYLMEDTSLCGNFHLLLDAGNPGMQYKWIPTNETTQTIFANKQTAYSVTVTNQDGCFGKGKLNINGNCISKQWFPNSFTPDGDLLNETFKPSLTNFENYEMRIFNRWGELLFETMDYNQGWDGTYKGVICQSGVYFFVSNFISTENNARQIVKGAITLIK